MIRKQITWIRVSSLVLIYFTGERRIWQFGDSNQRCRWQSSKSIPFTVPTITATLRGLFCILLYDVKGHLDQLLNQVESRDRCLFSRSKLNLFYFSYSRDTWVNSKRWIMDLFIWDSTKKYFPAHTRNCMPKSHHFFAQPHDRAHGGLFKPPRVSW